MSNKKGPSFPFIIIAIVLGWGIYKEFDVEKSKFDNTALAVIYILTFLMCVYFILKSMRGK